MKPQRLEGKGRWAVVALVVLVGVSAFARAGARGSSAGAVVSKGVQEKKPSDACPGEGVILRVDTGETPPVTFTVRHVPLSEDIADIPEFHDCQRFVVKDSKGSLIYDSLFAVFASYRLNILFADLKKSQDTITVPYGNAGIVVKTVPVATIFSDHGHYGPLGIAPGFNCLLLYALPAPAIWGAKLIPLTRPDSNCVTVDPHKDGTMLQVRASSTPGLAESDYPAAARWDWDPVHSEQYIGIKCGPAWCQVGRMGFDTSASYREPPLPFSPIRRVALPGVAKPFTPAERSRVIKVKGWYDEQWLATSLNRPSAYRGKLIPNPHIHELGAALDVYDAKWVQVGFAVITGGDYHKWNYRQMVNEVSLCHGTASACNIDTNQHPEPPSTTTLLTCDWWASVQPLRVVASSSGPRFLREDSHKYFCVTETSHAAELAKMNTKYGNVVSSLPGTARWRWLAYDEGSWFGCKESGCCSPR